MNRHAMAIAAFALAASFCMAQSQPRNTPSKTSSGTKDPKAAAGPVVNDSKWTKGPSKEWFVNWDKALDEARKTGKALFILNTGSDWCGWCKRLRAEVLDQSEFIKFARRNLVLVYLDNPHGKPLCEEQTAHNRHIVKALRFGGGVPQVVVMNAKGEKLGVISGGGQKKDEYLKKLKETLEMKGETIDGEDARLLFSEGYAKTVAGEPPAPDGERREAAGANASRATAPDKATGAPKDKPGTDPLPLYAHTLPEEFANRFRAARKNGQGIRNAMKSMEGFDLITWPEGSSVKLVEANGKATLQMRNTKDNQKTLAICLHGDGCNLKLEAARKSNSASMYRFDGNGYKPSLFTYNFYVNPWSQIVLSSINGKTQEEIKTFFEQRTGKWPEGSWVKYDRQRNRLVVFSGDYNIASVGRTLKNDIIDPSKPLPAPPSLCGFGLGEKDDSKKGPKENRWADDYAPPRKPLAGIGKCALYYNSDGELERVAAIKETVEIFDLGREDAPEEFDFARFEDLLEKGFAEAESICKTHALANKLMLGFHDGRDRNAAIQELKDTGECKFMFLIPYGTQSQFIGEYYPYSFVSRDMVSLTVRASLSSFKIPFRDDKRPGRKLMRVGTVFQLEIP